MSSILSMEPYIQEVADKTWSKFYSFAKSNQTIDLGAWVPYFTFDVVGQLSLGGEIGFVERGEDVDNIISSIHTGQAQYLQAFFFFFFFNMKILTQSVFTSCRIWAVCHFKCSG
jgi:hypothetical protein